MISRHIIVSSTNVIDTQNADALKNKLPTTPDIQFSMYYQCI